MSIFLLFQQIHALVVTKNKDKQSSPASYPIFFFFFPIRTKRILKIFYELEMYLEIPNGFCFHLCVCVSVLGIWEFWGFQPNNSFGP